MMLKSVLCFVFDNIGNPLSSKKIADTMTSDGRKIDAKTVEKYLVNLRAKTGRKLKKENGFDLKELRQLSYIWSVFLGKSWFPKYQKNRKASGDICSK